MLDMMCGFVEKLTLTSKRDDQPRMEFSIRIFY